MIDQDTSIGGQETRFPDTRNLAIGLQPLAPEAMLAAYWKPVYKYIRVQWKRSNEDSKDLTQGFFARALEKDFFAGYDPSKGRFRTYLRASLDNFIRSHHQAEHRLKRSLDAPVLSLEFTSAEGEVSLETADPGRSMEDYFQLEWIRHLFATAVMALERDYVARGRQVRFDIFRRYDLEEPETLTYDRLAAEFGVTTSTATNWLAAARRDFRRMVLQEVRSITSNEAEFRKELKAILG